MAVQYDSLCRCELPQAEGRRKLHEREAAAMRQEWFMKTIGRIFRHIWTMRWPDIRKDRRALLLRFFETCLWQRSANAGNFGGGRQEAGGASLGTPEAFARERGRLLPAPRWNNAPRYHCASRPGASGEGNDKFGVERRIRPANSSSASTLAKGAAKMMIRVEQNYWLSNLRSLVIDRHCSRACHFSATIDSVVAASAIDRDGGGESFRHFESGR